MTPAERTAVRSWAIAALAGYVPAERITWEQQDHPRDARVFAVLAIVSDVSESTPERVRIDAATMSETQQVLVGIELQVYSRRSDTAPDHWQNADTLIDLARRHLRSETVGREQLFDQGLGVAGSAEIANLSALVEGGSQWDSRAALTFQYRFRRRYDYAEGVLAAVSGQLTAFNTPDSLTADIEVP